MRTVGSNGEATEKMLRVVGVRLIAKYGYEAVSLRMLAKEVGIQAGSLYNYINNKQEFLFDLLQSIITDLFDDMDARMSGVEDPLERLKVFVAVHIEFHTRRKDEVFIGNMELRSLSDEHRKIIVGMRNRYEQLLGDIIQAGLDTGQFHVRDGHVAKLAILAMLTGVSHWYKPSGRLRIGALIDEYTEFAMAILQADTPS